MKHVGLHRQDHKQYYLGVGCWGSGIHGEGGVPYTPIQVLFGCWMLGKWDSCGGGGGGGRGVYHTHQSRSKIVYLSPHESHSPNIQHQNNTACGQDYFSSSKHTKLIILEIRCPPFQLKTRSTRRAQNSLAEADHYSHIVIMLSLKLGGERLPPSTSPTLLPAPRSGYATTIMVFCLPIYSS